MLIITLVKTREVGPWAFWNRLRHCRRNLFRPLRLSLTSFHPTLTDSSPPSNFSPRGRPWFQDSWTSLHALIHLPACRVVSCAVCYPSRQLNSSTQPSFPIYILFYYCYYSFFAFVFRLKCIFFLLFFCIRDFNIFIF